jgi:hypothetical protein
MKCAEARPFVLKLLLQEGWAHGYSPGEICVDLMRRLREAFEKNPPVLGQFIQP